MPRGAFAINPAATPIGTVNGQSVTLNPVWYRFFSATQAEVGGGIVGLLQNAPFITYGADTTLKNALILIGGVGLGLTSSPSTITIDLSDTLVAPGIYGSSVSVAAFDVDAQGRLVGAASVPISATGIGAALSSRTITAGAGLTGGGDLAADISLAVGAGSGITVNADDIALTVPTAAGTFTPTLTGVANVDAVTAHVCYYQRVGSIVHVSGRLDIDPATALAAVIVGVSLPISSAFTNENDLHGQINGLPSGYNNCAGVLRGDVANDRGSIEFVAQINSNSTYMFDFTYQVI